MSRDVLKKGTEIIFKATGEVVELEKNYIGLNDKDSVVTEKQKSGLEKKHNRTKYEREVLKEYGEFFFMQLEHDETMLQKANIDGINIVRIVYLATFANSDGLIIKDDGLHMKRKDIQSILRISKNTMPLFEKYMLEKNVLKKNDGKYYLSKDYLFKGKIEKKSKNKRHVKMFIKTIRCIYETNPRDYIGFELAISLFPQLKYNSHFAFRDPRVDEDDLEYLTVKEWLKDYVPKRQRTLVKKLSELKFDNGEYLFAFILVGSIDIKDARIMINPAIGFFGDASEFLKVRDIFTNEVKKNEEFRKINKSDI